MLQDCELTELAVKIKHRDKEAYRSLYTIYMPVMYAFAFRYTYNSDAAKDLVHDAFVWLWNNPQKIDVTRNIVHFLHTIVRNNCLHYLRDLRIHDSHNDKLIEAAVLSFTPFIPDDSDDADLLLRQKLQQTLQLLPEKSHEILLMHIVQGLRISQIAEKQGIAESTVKTHIKRAMKTLREHLLSLFF